jgi:hypothetical protein
MSSAQKIVQKRSADRRSSLVDSLGVGSAFSTVRHYIGNLCIAVAATMTMTPFVVPGGLVSGECC